MKARHFKKLRATSQYFLVEELNKNGVWVKWDKFSVARLIGQHVVLATNPINAVFRYQKRTNYAGNIPHRTIQSLANYRVVPANKPYARFLTYWS